MNDYNMTLFTRDKRLCSKHSDQPLTTMGCRKCGKALCADCVDDGKGCNGESTLYCVVK